MRRAGILLLVAGVTSCASSVSPGSQPGEARTAGGRAGSSGSDPTSIAPPETLEDSFVVRCDDSDGASPTSLGDVVSPLLGISAPRPPPENRSATVVRRYRARPPEGAAELPPAVALALDASRAVFETCLEDEDSARYVELTVTVDAAGRVVSVAAPDDRGRMQRCLMVRMCDLRGAPSAGPTKAVIPLVIKPIVGLNGVPAPDLPAVSIVSASLRSSLTGALESEEQRAVSDTMISLMTQAAAVCQRAPLAGSRTRATFAVEFTAHSAAAPTLSFGEITRGDPPPDQALLQCVTEALAGRRMRGAGYSGSMKVRVTWAP
jgi:hypothetical protein